MKTVKHVFTHVRRRHVSDTNKPERPPKPHVPGISETRQIPCQTPRPLPCLPSDDKYTKLKFTETSDIIYERASYSDNDLPEVNTLPESVVLRANQTEENFFQYSVSEVSFCFEHCGLESLASLCRKQKLDGLFFKGFHEWDMFSLSRFETAVVNKIIYHGWRPKTDKNEYTV